MTTKSTTMTTAAAARAQRQFEGEVVGAGAPKTIRVAVKTIKMHPKYHKQYVRTKAYAVHDERGEAKLGDTVSFQECRPLSKTKRWRLLRVVKRQDVTVE